MARTYNKSSNAKPVTAKSVQEPEKASEIREEKGVQIHKVKATAPVTQESRELSKKKTSAKTVISAPDKDVLQKIVYQPSAQILTREVDPSESFGIGDDMPIYYL